MKESLCLRQSKRGANMCGHCLNMGSLEKPKTGCPLGFPKIAKAILEWMVLCNFKNTAPMALLSLRQMV
jgi:hypothetical protein